MRITLNSNVDYSTARVARTTYKIQKEEPRMSREHQKLGSFSRRTLLRAGAGLAGGALLPTAMTMPAFAVGLSDQPAIGTWPAGSEGDTVNVGAAVPRTGTYAVQGEDELKGWQLAVEHINNGDALLKKIAPKVSKGLLGKKSIWSSPTVRPSRTRRCRSNRPSSTRTRSC
jgi:hypothetical protein